MNKPNQLSVVIDDLWTSSVFSCIKFDERAMAIIRQLWYSKAYFNINSIWPHPIRLHSIEVSQRQRQAKGEPVIDCTCNEFTGRMGRYLCNGLVEFWSIQGPFIGPRNSLSNSCRLNPTFIDLPVVPIELPIKSLIKWNISSRYQENNVTIKKWRWIFVFHCLTGIS